MPKPRHAKPALVSVIVVNYNRADLLGPCLDSLRAQDHPACEIIVVDNGSADASLAVLASQPGPLTVVALGANTGFTGGNIAGLAKARGSFVALVNNDVTVAPDWVSSQLRALARHPRAGFTASRIVRQDDPSRLDCAGDGMASSGWGYKMGEGLPAEARPRQEWVFGASAAAALYRRTMLDETGFLDPAFFFGCEDVDLSFRAQLMGWGCLYVPSAVARHRVGASHGLLRGKAVFYWSRNNELVWLKNMPAGLMLRFLHHRLAHQAWSLCRNLGRPGFLLNLALGKLALLPLLPHALRERRRIQGARKASLQRLAGLMTPVLADKFRRRKVDAGGAGTGAPTRTP